MWTGVQMRASLSPLTPIHSFLTNIRSLMICEVKEMTKCFISLRCLLYLTNNRYHPSDYIGGYRMGMEIHTVVLEFKRDSTALFKKYTFAKNSEPLSIYEENNHFYFTFVCSKWIFRVSGGTVIERNVSCQSSWFSWRHEFSPLLHCPGGYMAYPMVMRNGQIS